MLGMRVYRCRNCGKTFEDPYDLAMSDRGTSVAVVGGMMALASISHHTSHRCEDSSIIGITDCIGVRMERDNE